MDGTAEPTNHSQVAATPATYQSPGLTSPRCSARRHRATKASRETRKLRRGTQSTAAAVTSMRLVSRQTPTLARLRGSAWARNSQELRSSDDPPDPRQKRRKGVPRNSVVLICDCQRYRRRRRARSYALRRLQRRTAQPSSAQRQADQLAPAIRRSAFQIAQPGLQPIH